MEEVDFGPSLDLDLCQPINERLGRREAGRIYCLQHDGG